jgi:hypothetical protein
VLHSQWFVLLDFFLTFVWEDRFLRCTICFTFHHQILFHIMYSFWWFIDNLCLQIMIVEKIYIMKRVTEYKILLQWRRYRSFSCIDWDLNCWISIFTERRIPECHSDYTEMFEYWYTQRDPSQQWPIKHCQVCHVVP